MRSRFAISHGGMGELFDERRNSPRISRNYRRNDGRHLVPDALDLREAGRHIAPRHRPEIASGLDRRTTAADRQRWTTGPLQQAVSRVWYQALTLSGRRWGTSEPLDR